MNSVVGKWIVKECDFGAIVVKKVNGQGFSFIVGDEEFNSSYFPYENIVPEEFNAINWPCSLQVGETITIVVTSTGDYYTED